MAIKQVAISDISNEEVPDESHARVVIEHPDMTFPVELDTSVEEADKFQSTALRLVTLTIYAPNVPPRTVTVETRTLDKLFDKVDFNKVLEGARKADVSPTAPRRGRPAGRGGSKASTGEKRDYTSPEWAGVEHRGRTTEAEAMWVRDNLDAANANRAREGQAPIDIKDAKMIKRYGFK